MFAVPWTTFCDSLGHFGSTPLYSSLPDFAVFLVPWAIVFSLVQVAMFLTFSGNLETQPPIFLSFSDTYVSYLKVAHLSTPPNSPPVLSGGLPVPRDPLADALDERGIPGGFPK